MKSVTWIFSSLALAIALITAPIVWADGEGFHQRPKGHKMSHHKGGHGHWHGGGASHLLRHLLRDKQELGLTDEQITKLRQTALDAVGYAFVQKPTSRSVNGSFAR